MVTVVGEIGDGLCCTKLHFFKRKERVLEALVAGACVVKEKLKA